MTHGSDISIYFLTMLSFRRRNQKFISVNRMALGRTHNSDNGWSIPNMVISSWVEGSRSSKTSLRWWFIRPNLVALSVSRRVKQIRPRALLVDGGVQNFTIPFYPSRTIHRSWKFHPNMSTNFLSYLDGGLTNERKKEQTEVIALLLRWSN